MAKAAKDAGDSLDIDDVIDLLNAALESYEVKLPESEASPSS
jgi:hypothetical protein